MTKTSKYEGHSPGPYHRDHFLCLALSESQRAPTIALLCDAALILRQRDELAAALRIAKDCWLPPLHTVTDPSERKEIEQVNAALAKLEENK